MTCQEINALKIYQWVVALFVLAVITETAEVSADAQLCRVETDFGPLYEVFIQDLKEDFPLGKEIKELKFLGSSDQLQLRVMSGETGNEYLEFDTSSRILSLKKSLDSENMSESIVLKIGCTEIGGLVSNEMTVTVLVIIKDVNDNPPKFVKNEYRITNLPELTPIGSPVISNIEATDPDSSNAYVAYYIVQGEEFSSYFDIPIPAKGIVTLNRSLDYETIKNMTVTIMAKDNPNSNSEPQFNDTVKLYVTIADGDDQNPFFYGAPYTGTVIENATVNTQVIIKPQILAEDQDVNIKSPVRYSLVKDTAGDSEFFRINPNNGDVFVYNDALIRGKVLYMQVQAVQTDNPNRYATAGLRIVVQAANVNPPKFFRETYRAELVENVPMDTSVLTVSAIDMDMVSIQTSERLPTELSLGTILKYSFKQPSQDFKIDQRSGEVRTARLLDYETIKQYDLTVVVSDGNHTDSAKLTIVLVNINDNNPIFKNSSYHFNAMRVPDAILGQLEVTDKDGDTTFHFTQSKYQHLFNIDRSGLITVKVDLSNLTQKVYTFSVTVTDNGIPPRQAVAPVTIMFDGPPKTAESAPQTSESSFVVIYILAALVAILMVVMIVLLIYIKRRPKPALSASSKQTNEQIHIPESNTQEKNSRPNSYPATEHYSLPRDPITRYTIEGSTTTQDNPLALDNHGFTYPYRISDEDVHDDRTVGGVGEIMYDTAITPYEDENENTHVHGIGNGSVRSMQSSNGHALGSTQRLVNDGRGHGSSASRASKAKANAKKLSWGKNRQLDYEAESPIDPDVSVEPDSVSEGTSIGMPAEEQKPSITIYF